MGFADLGPTPGAGSHPEQELSHASLGRVRAGQGRNADNTTLGTMVMRSRSMQTAGCAAVSGVGQIIFIPACVPEYSAAASSIHHVNSAHVC